MSRRPHLWSSWCGLPGVWGWAGPGEAAGRWRNTWGQAETTHSDKQKDRQAPSHSSQNMTCLTVVLKQTLYKAVKKPKGFLKGESSFFPQELPIYLSHPFHQTSNFQLYVFTTNNILGVSWSIFSQSSTKPLQHPSITHLPCSKTVTFLTYRHCKCSFSRWGPHTLPGQSRAEWNFCVETEECSLRPSCRWFPLRWRRPRLWASARRTQWQTAGAGSPAEPQNPEETGRGSGGAGPDPDTPGKRCSVVQGKHKLKWWHFISINYIS